jgi:predicted RNase H-like HicB family nuclease
MLTRYIQAAMRRAQYELLEDRTFYGSVSGFEGVWANESTLEACRPELQDALEDWILLGVSLNHDLPVV